MRIKEVEAEKEPTFSRLGDWRLMMPLAGIRNTEDTTDFDEKVISSILG